MVFISESSKADLYEVSLRNPINGCKGTVFTLKKAFYTKPNQSEGWTGTVHFSAHFRKASRSFLEQ